MEGYFKTTVVGAVSNIFQNHLIQVCRQIWSHVVEVIGAKGRFIE